MSEALQLNAQPRPATKGATHRARREGYVPGVLYGADVPESITLKVAADDLRAVLSRYGHHPLLRLTVGDEQQSRLVMVRDLQVDNMTNTIVHVDFHQVSTNKRVHTRVPIRLIGEDEVTKQGLVLERQLRDVDVEGLPGDLPELITVNVGALEPGDTLHVSDLPVPTGCRITSDSWRTVATVEIPRIIMEPDAAAAGLEVTGG